MTSASRLGRALVPVILLSFSILGCRRSSLVDLPLWRVETDPSGREVRVVDLPFEQSSYDLTTHALIRRVIDQNQDGISDRIIRYEGFGGARAEEIDTNFDGIVDRWDTFGPEGKRLRSAIAQGGTRPNQIATYNLDGILSRVEIDGDLDGRFELVRIYQAGTLVENRIDSDHDGRADRIQDFSKGYLSAEDFDIDENGTADIRMTYARDGSLLKVSRPSQASGPGHQ
jgi:hypothetical protein